LPKPDGGKRLIEAPNEALKKVQQKLNFFFQAYYHGIRPMAVYGGVAAADNDLPVRNILSNARRHLNRQWILNMDLTDFYHQITADKTIAVLRNVIGMPEKLAEGVTNLCCFKKRLPMGAPTSCIVANIVCLDLDKALQSIADQHNIRYTRFIDDMTFSANQEIAASVIDKIRQAIEQCGFHMNEHKMWQKHLANNPEVTGLVLQHGKVDVATNFINDLKKDIILYRQMVRAGERLKQIFHARNMNHFRQHLYGKVNFIGFVRGKMDATFKQLKKRMTVVTS
jgi:RNA-directed DNA polymerase